MVWAVTSDRSQHPIVLFHDGKASVEPEFEISSYRGNTVASLDRIIDFFEAGGFVFTGPAGAAFT